MELSWLSVQPVVALYSPHVPSCRYSARRQALRAYYGGRFAAFSSGAGIEHFDLHWAADWHGRRSGRIAATNLNLVDRRSHRSLISQYHHKLRQG